MNTLSPLLDLSGADTSGFEPAPAGIYDAVVYDAEWTETAGGDNAKLPKGTPMLKVQFKIIEGGEEGKYYNYRVWGQYTLPPEVGIDGQPYPKDKAARLLGGLVNFFVAIGYDETEVRGKKFDPDLAEVKGRECRVLVGRQEYPKGSGTFTNNLKGVKPIGAASGSGALL